MTNTAKVMMFYFPKTIMSQHSVAYGICRLLVGKSPCLFVITLFDSHLALSFIISRLKQQLFHLEFLPQTLGITQYLSDVSNNVTLGALEVLHPLLVNTPPSPDLFVALKRPFEEEVIARTPLSSRRTRGVIKDYLMVCTCRAIFLRMDLTH